MAEKGRNDVQLQSFLDWAACWVNGGSASHVTDRTLKFVSIHGCDQSIVVEIIKWLMDAGEILKVREHQELAVAETFCLVHSQRPHALLVIG
jgi:hypothetical protein